VKLVLPVFAEMIEAMEVNEERTAAAAGDPFLLATDIADYLVLRASHSGRRTTSWGGSPLIR